MKRSQEMLIALGAVLAGFSPGPVRALSLRNSAAEIVVGLTSGERTRTVPLTVTNTGLEKAVLRLEVLPPAAAELKDGYEPIPDLGWVRFKTWWYALDPGGSASAQALIALPRGKGVKPGWYQAQWVSEAESPAGLRLRLPSKLLVRVKPERRRLEERRRKTRKREGLDIVLSPPRAKVRVEIGRGAPAGRLKAANANVEVVTVEARALDPAEAPDAPRLPEGWEWAPNPDWLATAAEFVEVAAGKVGELELVLDIPDQDRYRGRRWAFLVEARMLEDAEEKTKRHLLLVETSERRL